MLGFSGDQPPASRGAGGILPFPKHEVFSVQEKEKASSWMLFPFQEHLPAAAVDHDHLSTPHSHQGAEGSAHCPHKPGHKQDPASCFCSGFRWAGSLLLLVCTTSFMLLTFPRNSKWQNRRYCNLELLTLVNWWEYWNVHVPYLTAPPVFLIRCSAQPFRIHIRQLTSGLNIY